MLLGESTEFLNGGCMGETDHLEITGMDPHQADGTIGDGVFIIGNIGTIGGTDFNQLSPALTHDVGDTETITDLDSLPARDNDLFSFSQGGETEEDGGGIIVDDEGSFGAGQSTNQRFNKSLTRAAFAAFNFEFYIGKAFGDLFHGGNGITAQGSAAEISVENDAGGIYQRTQVRFFQALQDRNDRFDNFVEGGGGFPRVMAERSRSSRWRATLTTRS